MTIPAVSVVMPVFNVRPYVAEAIASVLAQTVTDFELIVVDDGSTDGSRAVCEGFTDPRIRLIVQSNQGLPAARNTGITAARAELVALLDSDDRWLPRKLERHLAHLAARPEVDVSYGPSRFIDAAGRPLRLMQMPRLTGVEAPHIFCRNPVGNGSAPVIRMAAFTRVGHPHPGGEPRVCYFDEVLLRSQDIEMWVRLALVGGARFEGIPDVLTEYRVVDSGLSASLEPKYASWLLVTERIARYAPEFLARHMPRARAYQLRYVARRAVQLGDGPAAWRLLCGSLRSEWRISLEEPRKTATTAAAALAMRVLPPPAARRLVNAVSGGTLVAVGG